MLLVYTATFSPEVAHFQNIFGETYLSLVLLSDSVFPILAVRTMTLHIALYVLFVILLTFHPIASHIDLHTLRNDEIAILQYDSRTMGDYWQVAAEWNKHYCDKHGHKFIYYASREGCHYHGEKLATPWCKVKAMIQANQDFPEIKFFIYMDSDAVLDKQFADIPLSNIIGTMQTKLEWDPKAKPIIFNQDGPCWWCRLVKSVGYDMCLNAGKHTLV